MNRELKFRVWYYDQKKFDNNLELGDFKRYSFPLYWCCVQQYTGLKDKNGKDIYEGDILFFQQQDGVWPDQLNRRMEVKYPFVCGNAHLGEIIGNIFETPELLK